MLDLVAIDFRLPLSDLPYSFRLADRDDLPSRISFNDLSRSFRRIVRMLIRIISGPTLSSLLHFVLSSRFFHRLPLAKYMRTSAKLMVDVSLNYQPQGASPRFNLLCFCLENRTLARSG